MKAPVAAATPETPWQEAWPAALDAWSAYTLLCDPLLLATQKESNHAGLGDGIAAIRLRDQAIMVNLARTHQLGLERHALAILAHEVGHHVYVPGNLADNARLLAAVGRSLPGIGEPVQDMVANIYADMLINDRLQRRGRADMAAVYAALQAQDEAGSSAVWRVTTRALEHLWRQPPGRLAPAGVTPTEDADAALLARIVRTFAGDWLRGARRFAMVLYPHVATDQEASRSQPFDGLGLGDLRQAGKGAPGERDADAIPDGLTQVDDAESGDDGFDASLDDPLAAEGEPRSSTESPQEKDGPSGSQGQARTPFEYGQILRALGLKVDEHEVTTRYYRERALPHLIPFPTRRAPTQSEPLPEGTEPWQTGETLESLDVFHSVLQSPVLVPGVSTVQRVYGETPGSEPARTPLDLDIYVDCSGSMPNPVSEVSYLALAATILSLSALRAGARVQATLWSSAGVFETTAGFIRDEKRVLGTVTGYVPGGTAFPLHILRDTFEARKPSDPPAHVVVISDSGADTMLEKDEKGNDGAGVCTRALERACGGGTLVLNLPTGYRWEARKPLQAIGFRIYAVQEWADLVEFARRFVQDTWGEDR